MAKMNAVVVAMVAMVVAMVGVEGACPDIDLDSCLPAAEADVDPTAECCTGLTTYTSSNDVTCLCEAAMGTTYFTSNPVDYAILIPQKCGLNYAAGTECGGTMSLPFNLFQLHLTNLSFIVCHFNEKIAAISLPEGGNIFSH